MKIKNILGIALSALLITACSEDDPIGTLDSIKLDQSFVSVPMEGGTVTVKVSAATDWQIDGTYQKIVKNADGTRDTTYTPLPNSPAWLTATQLSGTAGEAVITFTATATEGGREAEIRFSAGGSKQFLIIRQGSLEATTAKCSEVIAGPDSKNYRVTGTVMKIANTTYGNWYLNDGTSETDLYIYGTNDKNGKKANNPIDGTDGWKFEVGDVVTVEGPKTTYNGTVELVDVTVIKVVKSLIKLPVSEAELPQEGGSLAVKVAYKGSGAYFDIKDDAKSWLTYQSVSYVSGVKTIFEQNPADTAVYVFNVAPNTLDSRSGAIIFTSASGSNSSSITYTVNQKGVAFPPKGTGTKDDPFNVTAALNYTRALGADNVSANDVYVKGKISSIKYTYSAQFGTATYNISADGNESDVFTVYGSYFFDNQPWQEGQTQIAVGDEVIVCGKVVDYKGTTPEFSNKKNWLVSINGKTSEGNSTPQAGTLENPFTVAQAMAYIDASGADEVYVQGVVSKVVYAFDADHGTGTFWISPDGTFNNDKSKDFEAYSVLWLGNKSWVAGNGQVAVGDKVVLCGKLTKYKDTYETSSKKAYVYSLNGQTE